MALLLDGKTVVSSGEDQTIRLWDVTTGKEERQFLGHQASVRNVALSPDGKTLVSKSDSHEKYNSLRFWEVATGKELRRISAYDANCTLAFSPDGKTLGVSAKNGIGLVDLASARERFQLVKNGTYGTFVAFSPNGKSVAWGSFNDKDRFCLHFSDATAGKNLGTVEIDTSSQANWGEFSADGETLLILMDGQISAWSMAGKQESVKFGAGTRFDINCRRSLGRSQNFGHRTQGWSDLPLGSDDRTGTRPIPRARRSGPVGMPGRRWFAGLVAGTGKHWFRAVRIRLSWSGTWPL